MLIRLTIEVLYKCLAYFMLLTGIWILVHPVLIPVYKPFRFIRDQKYSGSIHIQKMNSLGYKNALFKQCDMLLRATWKRYKAGTTLFFFIFSFSLLVSSLPIYYRLTNSWLVSIVFSFVSALLPYIFLRVRLSLIRSDTSHQLVPAVSLLLANYRICSKDIYFSVMRSIDQLENNTLQKSFIVLTQSIQRHETNHEIEEAIGLFVFKIQTSWAKQLGVLLSNAIIDGRDIEQSLSNIVKDMKQGQQIIEEEKSSSHDTIIMGYLPLLAFPLTILFLQFVSGRFKVLYYQFKTAQGLTSFMITSLMCITGFIIATVFKKPKNDL